MNEVVEIKALKDYRVWLRFKDDEVKIVNLRPFLGKGFTAELLDPSKFKKVFIELGSGIAWENGYDFCPNFLKELEGKKVELA
jgi:hypothetical protein